MTKVLIVEDDLHTRTALVEVFRGEGFTVESSADGADATERFQAFQPDLVCLDVMLPRTSGYDLCRAFRRQRPNVPILFITAKGEEVDRVVGLELGGDDYIVKPFGIREVLARVRAVLRRCQPGDTNGANAKEAASEIVSFDMNGLEIIPQQLRARRDGECIELTPRECQLLELFYRRAGEVLTRAEIFQQVWGHRYCPNSRTLDQMISQLRRRIEVDPRHPNIIQTVHGAGYRFDRQGVKQSR